MAEYKKIDNAYKQLGMQVRDYRFANLERLKILHNFINVFNIIGETDIRTKLTEGNISRAYELAIIEDTYFVQFLNDFLGLIAYAPVRK